MITIVHEHYLPFFSYPGCNSLHRFLTFLMGYSKKAFKNIVRKGETARSQHFLLFLSSFVAILKSNVNFSVTFIQLIQVNLMLSITRSLKLCTLAKS